MLKLKRLCEIFFVAAVTLPFAFVFPLLYGFAFNERRGDVFVFFNAAWTVWNGLPLYESTDLHHWAYHYPPTLALLFRFFAQAPIGKIDLPFTFSPSTSFAIYYALNAIFFWLSAHFCASTIERLGLLNNLSGQWRKALMLRCWTAGGLIFFAFTNLGKGQVDAAMIFLVSLFFYGYVVNRRVFAGVALALAFAIKLYVLPLLFFPLLRRDYKTLLAFIGGAGLLLIVFPATTLGLSATFDLYVILWRERLSGIIGGNPSEPIAHQLSFLATDVVSISAMLGRIIYYAAPIGTVKLPMWIHLSQKIFGAIIMGLLFWYGHHRFWSWRKNQPPLNFAWLLGAAILCATLPLIIPTAELQYWLCGMPLLAALIVYKWRSAGEVIFPRRLFFWVLALSFAAHATENLIWAPLKFIGFTTPLFIGIIIYALGILRASPTNAETVLTK